MSKCCSSVRTLCVEFRLARNVSCISQSHFHLAHAARVFRPGLTPAGSLTLRVFSQNHTFDQKERILNAATETTWQQVNPPDFTRPPPLDVPTRSSSDGRVGHWWKVGKAYGRFYWGGTKRLWTSRKSTRDIYGSLKESHSVLSRDLHPSQRSQQVFGRQSTTLLVRDLCRVNQGSHSNDKDPTWRRAWDVFEKLDRAQFQALVRYERDRTKIPVFAVLIIVLGEWLALLAPIMPVAVFPRTCRTPTQERYVYKQAQSNRAQSFKTDDLAQAQQNMLNTLGPGAHIESTLGKLGSAQVRHLVACVGVSSSDAWWPTALLSRSLRHHIQYLAADDFLLHRAGHATESLSDTELLVACHERGMDVIDRETSELRSALTRYLELLRPDAVDGDGLRFIYSLLSKQTWEKMQTGGTAASDLVPLMDKLQSGQNSHDA